VRPLAGGPESAAAVLSQENLRQDRESLPSAAAPIIAATPAEHKQCHDDQDDDRKSIHNRSLLWAKTRPASALNQTRSRSHTVTTSLAHLFHRLLDLVDGLLGDLLGLPDHLIGLALLTKLVIAGQRAGGFLLLDVLPNKQPSPKPTGGDNAEPASMRLQGPVRKALRSRAWLRTIRAFRTAPEPCSPCLRTVAQKARANTLVKSSSTRTTTSSSPRPPLGP
jgi:hypothetical protein